jgi:hypothetical protein
MLRVTVGSALVALSLASIHPTSITTGTAAADAPIDRFSAAAGHLQVRSAANHIPGPNEPVNFDTGPFITHGFGPNGEKVIYYNFDVQPTTAAPIYVFYAAGATAPLAGQDPVVTAIPGEATYNDFHRVIKVTVPASYKANSATSLADITAGGWPTEQTTTLVNDPIVPRGSTASKRADGSSAALHHGWYGGKRVYFFTFEQTLMGDAAGTVPRSPIFVTFARNPGTDGGGPASGFKTEPGTLQAHNVTASLPGQPAYSPLWSVSVYDNANFDAVKDLATLGKAKLLANNVATVNCPIVSVKTNAMQGMKGM